MLKSTKKYAYCVNDNERFEGEYDSFNDAMEAGTQCLKDDGAEEGTVAVGEILEFVPVVDADFVLENIQAKADDDCCGCADNYLDGVSPENTKLLEEMLTKTFNEWAKQTKHDHTVYVIEDYVERKINHCDIERCGKRNE